jgi:regulatory protein
VAVLTGVAPDPRQPAHRLLEVDRGRFASLPLDALEGVDLTVGRTLDARTLARLARLADREAAFRAGVRALARRGFATRDLRRRLLQRQHPAAAVDAALARLEQRGLLDDTRYALQFAATRLARGRGPARVIRDLVGQGVDRELAEQAARAALGAEGVDPVEAARVAARRRVAALQGLPRPVQRRRLTAFLLRRGFGGPHLGSVVSEACARSEP